MALDDIKVTRPETKPERMTRVRDFRRFRDNYDAIFRKDKAADDTVSPKEVSNEAD